MNFATARQAMVEAQLRPNKVTNPQLLAACLQMPRHEFLSPECGPLAYADKTITLADGSYLIQPIVLGRLIEIANPTLTDKILDLSPAPGYSSGLLSYLTKDVVAVYQNPTQMSHDQSIFQKLKRYNLHLTTSNPAAGYGSHGPYDVILIAGVVEQIPELLWEQLKPHGRLVTIVQQKGQALGKATCFLKTQGWITPQEYFEVHPPLLAPIVAEFASEPTFEF